MHINLLLSTHFLKYLLGLRSLIVTENAPQDDTESQIAKALETLGLSQGASIETIRKAFMRLSLMYHPDKNRSPTANDQFIKIKNAYKILTNNMPAKPQPPLLLTQALQLPFIFSDLMSLLLLSIFAGSMQVGFVRSNHISYKNRETFANNTPSNEIPSSDLIVLDGYAFDVNELELLGKHTLLQFYKNPHITSAEQSKEFSESAKQQLREHPKLTRFARELDDSLAQQVNQILPATIDAAITLLQALHVHGVDGSSQAQRKFLDHKSTLTQSQQNSIDNYIISVRSQGGGFQRMRFEDAFNGGDSYSPCIRKTQIFLWQFVIDHRPDAARLIPATVHRMAEQANLVLNQPSMQRNQTPSNLNQNDDGDALPEPTLLASLDIQILQHARQLQELTRLFTNLLTVEIEQGRPMRSFPISIEVVQLHITQVMQRITTARALRQEILEAHAPQLDDPIFPFLGL